MKVLVVDDSVVFRMAIKQALEEVSDVEVVGALSNGQLAVDHLQKNDDVDLITLDMEMPVLDGMGALREIRKFNKTVPIIVFSSLTTKGAEKTIEALSLGANDFVTKQEAGGAASIDGSLEMIRQSLTPKIEALKKNQAKAAPQESSRSETTPAPSPGISMPIKPKLIVMASSTGGPEALGKVFQKLEKGSNIPILLVQHMPPVFTEKLAEMLTKSCPGYVVKEGKKGMQLESNTCYIAPGDYHMVLKKDGTLDLNQNEKVCFVRPAANCLFESVAENYDKQVACFVLTGMGDDGAEGVKKLAERNSYNFYQSENTCTVFGMPGAVKETGKASEVHIDDISKLINEINGRL